MLVSASVGLAVIAAIAFAVTMALYIRAFRRLVDIECRYAEDQWERDGRPLGGHRTRKQASFWGSDFATVACFASWLGATPSWASNIPEAALLLKRTRHFFALHVASGLIFFAILFWYEYGS